MPKTSVTFGGAPFSLPVPLGGGIRAKIAQERAELKREKLKQYDEPIQKAKMQALARACVEELLASDDAKVLPGIKTVILNKVVPILPDAYREEWLQENYPYDYTMVILRNILIPESEVTVAEAFDASDDSEVKVLVGFFTENVTGKTQSVESKTSDSKSTSARRKRKA